MSSSEFGVFLRTIGQKRVLTATEEQEYTRRAHLGDVSARDKMAEHNVRLVVSICKRYANMGFDLDDLTQEGCVGLMKAIERFDPDRGFKFSTYATWWIKQAVHRYMAGAGGGTIHVPARLQKVRRELRAYLNNHDVSVAEAAKALEIDPEIALDAMEGPRVTASLDAAIGSDGQDEGRHAQIADAGAVDPSEMFEDNDAQLRSALQELTVLQRGVLELRWGFHDRPTMGLNEIAEKLDVNKKVVQQAQAEGIKRLKDIYRREELKQQGADEEEASFRAAIENLEEENDESDITCQRPSG